MFVCFQKAEHRLKEDKIFLLAERESFQRVSLANLTLTIARTSWWHQSVSTYTNCHM